MSEVGLSSGYLFGLPINTYITGWYMTLTTLPSIIVQVPKSAEGKLLNRDHDSLVNVHTFIILMDIYSGKTTLGTYIRQPS